MFEVLIISLQWVAFFTGACMGLNLTMLYITGAVSGRCVRATFMYWVVMLGSVIGSCYLGFPWEDGL